MPRVKTLKKWRSRSSSCAAALLLLGVANHCVAADPAANALLSEFQQPPQEIRPRVWWHWLNGAISEEGIRRDMAWMDRAGIAGVQIFNVDMPNNQNVVESPLEYLSSSWKQAMNLAIDLATEKEMEVIVPTSAGWSETGAPFVTPDDGMKKLVWSKTEIEGGRPVTQQLKAPPDISGPFATVAINNRTLTGEQIALPWFYRDARVIAYRIPMADYGLPAPRVFTEQGEVDGKGLHDEELEKALELRKPTHEQPSWIRFEFPEDIEVRSLTAVLEPKAPEIGAPAQIPALLEVLGNDGEYRKVADLAVGAFIQNTNAFEPVRGRIFRVLLRPDPAPANPLAGLNMAPGAMLQSGLPMPSMSESMMVSEMALGSEARVHRFEEKAGFAAVANYYAVNTPQVPSKLAIQPENVLDISDRMAADGTLTWTPPAGRWRVIRYGYSLTGHFNGPAPIAATGLEVDKLSAPRVQRYMENYLNEFRTAVGPQRLGDKGIRGVLTDSYEAGFANWTDDILEQFEERRGYDPTPFLPALAGYVVNSAVASDGFLYDFRKTQSELLAEAHYGTIARVASEQGLTVYGEALESGSRPALGDDLAMRRFADVPMGAMWTFPPERGPAPAHIADLKGAASAAHLQGKRFVAAESFSSMFQPWAHSPRELKPVADYMLALGVNRFVIHSTVHQPLTDEAPGLTLWIFGQYFNRNETWAEQARPWLDYLARSSWLLSQGDYVADVAYFYGEEAPLVTLEEQGLLADVPVHFGYDYVNASELLQRFSVRDGKLVTPAGRQYHVLQLGGLSEYMTLPVLRKLHELVHDGATVVGERPKTSPSLADDQKVFQLLADDLWPSGESTVFGKGKVFAETPVEEALAQLGVAKDIEAISDIQMPFLFQHRALDAGHTWLVLNKGDSPFKGEFAFRAVGFSPERWDASNGTRVPLPFRVVDGRTLVKLDLAAHDSMHVVFASATEDSSRPDDGVTREMVASLDGLWTVQFKSGNSAPDTPQQMRLGSWTESDDVAIKYYSGTATYTRNVDFPATESDARLLLDLGEVGDLAEVSIDGLSLGTVWHPPYVMDLTGRVTPGRHRLVIKVSNRWVNRLIGDAQVGANKETWTVSQPYLAEAPLLASGLIGPVRLLKAEVKN